MGPLNTYYVQAIEKFLRNNPGRVISQFQVSKLFGEAYMKAATHMTAINGFRKCGIIPLDPNIFEDSDFVAAETAEIALIDPPVVENIMNESTSNEPDINQPSTSFTVSPSDIIPIPKTNVTSRISSRKKGTTSILTSSPYKAELEASMKKVTPRKRVFTKKNRNVKTKRRKIFLKSLQLLIMKMIVILNVHIVVDHFPNLNPMKGGSNVQNA